MITIGAVNWHSKDWARLLIDSVQKHTKEDYEILIFDNSNNLPDIDGCRIIHSTDNVGHGRGVDSLIKEAKGDYFLALDIDAHILRDGWDTELIELYKSDEKNRLIAAQGGVLKPFRPAVMFFDTEFFKKQGYTFKAVAVPCDKGHFTLDVGVTFGFRVLHDGFKVQFLPYEKTEFKDVNGEEYSLNGVRTFYHNWYGTRFYDTDEVDGRKKEDILKLKDNLFKQVWTN